MKKSLCLLIGLFILFSFNCYAVKAFASQQTEAKEWFNKAYDVNSLILKIEYYTKAIELNPEYTYAYYNRGIAYNDLGQYQKAIDDYTKAIELNPEYADAYGNRGLGYGLQGFPTAACGDFYQAGILFLEQNNITQALKCVDLIKKVDPSSPFISEFMDQINK